MKILLRHQRSISYHDLQTSDTALRSLSELRKENTCSKTSSGNEYAIVVVYGNGGGKSGISQYSSLSGTEVILDLNRH